MKNELYHHGILGMKWGIRRFQNKDGSLTTAGRKRYNVEDEVAKERVKAAKERVKAADKEAQAWNLLEYGQFGKTVNERAKTAHEKLDWEKSKLSSEKIKARWTANPHKKTKRQLKLEQQYLEKGMSQEEAEIAAYKRDRTEKILTIAAGVTVASAAAYVAYKQYDKTVNKLISESTSLQNISDNGGYSGVRDAFYSSMTKGNNVSAIISGLTALPVGSAAAVGAISGLQKVYRSKKRDKIVSEYKQKHPYTKLSYNEIVDQYYNK